MGWLAGLFSPSADQIEAGAMALFAAINTDGKPDIVKQRWSSYPDEEKNPYREWCKATLDGAVNSKSWIP